jgi:hypothetical protein
MMQLKEAHGFLEATMADVTQEVANYMPAGRANSVGACYAHVICGEDLAVNGMLKGGAPFFVSSHAGKTGLSEPMPMPGPTWVDYFPWTRRVKVDLPKLKAFAKEVEASSEKYVAGLKPQDLDREIDLSGAGLGMRTVAWVLSRAVIGHADNFTGEISAIKGVQGKKGYPA